MKNNGNKYKELRNIYQEFKYRGFSYSLTNSELSIVFDFAVDDEFVFNPKMTFVSSPFFHFEKISKNILESLIFNIGMVELISYWKAMVPPVVLIENYSLTDEQIAFWKKIYFNGLGEYFYLNGIEADYDDFLNIRCLGEKKLQAERLSASSSVVIPVGGGKDSVVSLELLKGYASKDDNLALIMNPRGASSATAAVAGFKDKTLIVRRSLDKLLLELNDRGFLNGHTPFSALLAFVTLLAATASGRRYIALSNESSANEPTVAGTNINHQYSKSLEFENDFSDYVEKYITPDIKYFSLLRPLSELQIASIFAKRPAYFGHFKSCNVGSKNDIWCGKCPKCLFTFIILSPFLAPEQLVEIFGSNLLEDRELQGYFDELTGVAEVKPFECIGTVDEVNAALCFAAEKYEELPYLLKRHRQYFGDEICKRQDKEALLKNISKENFPDPSFLKLVKTELGIDD